MLRRNARNTSFIHSPIISASKDVVLWTIQVKENTKYKRPARRQVIYYIFYINVILAQEENCFSVE